MNTRAAKGTASGTLSTASPMPMPIASTRPPVHHGDRSGRADAAGQRGEDCACPRRRPSCGAVGDEELPDPRAVVEEEREREHHQQHYDEGLHNRRGRGDGAGRDAGPVVLQGFHDPVDELAHLRPAEVQGTVDEPAGHGVDAADELCRQRQSDRGRYHE